MLKWCRQATVGLGHSAGIERKNGKQGLLDLICNANAVPSFIFGSNSLQQFIDNVRRVRASVCLGGRLHVCCCSWLAGVRWHRRRN